VIRGGQLSYSCIGTPTGFVFGPGARPCHDPEAKMRKGRATFVAFTDNNNITTCRTFGSQYRAPCPAADLVKWQGVSSPAP
jgi:hypothetical protein